MKPAAVFSLWTSLLPLLSLAASLPLPAFPQGSGNWAAYRSPHDANMLAAAWDGKQFAAVASGAQVYTSPDGKEWKRRETGITCTLLDIVHGASTFVAVGIVGYILTSPDGIEWTTQDGSPITTYGQVCWNGRQFAAVAERGLFTTSGDGKTWEGRYIASGSLRVIAWIGGRYYAGGDNGLLMSSTTGVSWITHPTGTTSAIAAIAGGGGRILALGFPNTLLSSRDGMEWKTKTLEAGHFYNDIVWTDGRFFLAGDAGRIRTTVDGEAWVDEASGTTEDLYGFALADTALLAVGSGGQAVVRSVSPSNAVFPVVPKTVGRSPILAWNARTGRMEFQPGASAIGARDAGVRWDARGRFLFIQERERP